MSSFFNAGHSRNQSPLHTDFTAFLTEDQDSDDDDDPYSSNRREIDSRGGSAHPPVLTSTANFDETNPSSLSHPPSNSTGTSSANVTSAFTIPGGYDFEPQVYEGGTGGPAPSSSVTETNVRPLSLSDSTSRFSSSGSIRIGGNGSLNSRNWLDSSGARSNQGGVQPRSGLMNWRGIVSRIGGGNGGSGSGQNRDDLGNHDESESNRLLFSQEESDETDSETHRETSSYPPRNIHLPLPARPPTFAAPIDNPSPSATASSTPIPSGRVYGGGSGNDGVFSNLAAKPEGANESDFVGEGPDKDEILPAYEAAALDSTPPYWETTVITPGGFLGPDDVCVDGMPVGNLFSFAWNLLVSMSFQFVGFLLTYLLHTTHAAKNGSRAGLGITLIQLGFYLKQHTDHSGDSPFGDGTPSDETGLNGGAGPNVENVRWSWWGGQVEEIDTPSPTSTFTSALGNLPTQIGNGLSGALDASNPDATPSSVPSLMGNGLNEAELNQMSMATNEWMSFALVTVGSFLLIGGCLSYWRAVRYARAMRQGQGPGIDNENMVAVS